MTALRVLIQKWLSCAIFMISICMILQGRAISKITSTPSSNFDFPFTEILTVDVSSVNNNTDDAILLTTIFSADFENTSGDNAWTFVNGASDGNWVIGTPTPYITGTTQMEIASFAGVQNLQTGINNSQDLDGGPAIAESPNISLSANATNIEINFNYYFAHYTNSSTDDNFIIEIRDASNNNTLTTLVNEVGSTNSRPAQWINVQQNISSLAGMDIYIYLSSQDVANGSKVESAIDQIEITEDVPESTLVCSNLITDSFESGLGNWTDGGSDCEVINNTTFANTGSFSIRLRDNSSSSITTSGPYNLSQVDEVRVSFSYMGSGMETGEDFWFQTSIDGGSSYNTIESWVAGTDFTNNNRQNISLTIPGPLSSNTVLRFVCDASANDDMIYIDDIVIDTCKNTPLETCFEVALSDTTLCNDQSMSIMAQISGITAPIVSQSWTVLPTTTATGYSITGTTTSTLSINPMGGFPGTLDLLYSATDSLGCTKEVEGTVFILGVEPCIIRVESDTICNSTSALLDATAIYQVFPDSGVVIAANSGVGNTVIHDIIGVQDPSGVKVTITLPTWDDHFDEILLNGNTIIPKVLEPQSWGTGGMDIQAPWNPNVNGLPRSILTIENNEVHYYISQTVNSTSMIEVFPTNWATTPQNFIPGNNTLQFGIQNTAGPVSGSWYIEAEGVSNYSYLWTTGDTTNTLEIFPTETTTVGVTITSPNGCTTYCEKTIYVHEFAVNLQDITLCAGDQTKVGSNMIPDVSGPYTYQWTMVSNGITGLTINNATSDSLTINAQSTIQPGVESIELIVTDKFGCSAIDTIHIDVVDLAQLTCTTKINDQPWTAGECTITACHGAFISFGVNYSSSSGITWIGPNGFSSTDEIIQISDLDASDQGLYKGYYSSGSCIDSIEINVTLIDESNSVFYADFENTSGDNAWTMVGGASGGNWLIGTPNPYSTNGFASEIPAYQGNQVLLTGAGVSEDLDGGPTVARSPNVTLPDSSTLDLRYYYAYYTNATADDYFYLMVRDSASGLVLDTLIALYGNPNGMSAAWETVVRDLSAYAGQTIYLEVRAADIANQSKIEVALDEVIIRSKNECSCDVPVYDTITLTGCVGDGYAEIINGTVYNESHPTGTETFISTDGCDSIVTIDLQYYPNYTNITRSYTGCEDDGYTIVVNGTTYNQANPTGIENMSSSFGCDSIITINLVFNPEVTVEAGMLPYPACSTKPIQLSELGASITGGSIQGQWSTMGTGTFDNGGNFSLSTIYTLSPADIDVGYVILTLTSNDPIGPCEPTADAILIEISDIRCSQFPWAGN